MSKFNSDNFIENYSFYHKVIYAFALICVVLNIFSQKEFPTNSLLIICMVLLLFLVADSILYPLEYFSSRSFFTAFRYIELLVFSTIQGYVAKSVLLLPVFMILVVFIAVEFILQGSDYEISSLHYRKYSLILPMLVGIFVAYDSNAEARWFVYFIMEFMLFLVAFIVVNWFIKLHSMHIKQINSIVLEMSQMESNNAKLLEYQERVKNINEQINYQRFELAKANKDLAQVNIEVSSQTEVMKYMTSTFDILKCINVLSDAIMEVKKPKFCAIYVDKNVYMNSLGSCIIKTNYSSMQRRLKKEIELIFEEASKGKGEPEILYNEELKRYKFIGDANINTVAVLPFVDGGKVYGMMIVGTDDVEFFSNGLGYFENCIVEFNVAVNRTKLYLKMQDMARKDGLTGIYNRVYFTELYEKALTDAKRRKKPISVALFDIDKFKNVNDTYGHIAGDKVIQMVASKAQEYADKYSGFACRYGGEEFLLVLPDYDEEKSLSVVEELHEDIKSTPVHFKDFDINVNVCIGLTSYPNLCDDTKILVSRADKAMYHGKNNGRGRLVVDNSFIDDEE